MAANQAGVAALDAAQPFTVVSDTRGSVAAGSAPTEIRSVTVTAPVDGRVAVAASAYMAEGTDGQRVQCGLMTTVVEPPPGEELFWKSSTVGTQAHLSATRVFDIVAGQTVTYFLVCNNASGGLSSSIGSPRVMAIFTPAA